MVRSTSTTPSHYFSFFQFRLFTIWLNQSNHHRFFHFFMPVGIHIHNILSTSATGSKPPVTKTSSPPLYPIQHRLLEPHPSWSANKRPATPVIPVDVYAFHRCLVRQGPWLFLPDGVFSTTSGVYHVLFGCYHFKNLLSCFIGLLSPPKTTYLILIFFFMDNSLVEQPRCLMKCLTQHRLRLRHSPTASPIQ